MGRLLDGRLAVAVLSAAVLALVGPSQASASGSGSPPAGSWQYLPGSSIRDSGSEAGLLRVIGGSLEVAFRSPGVDEDHTSLLTALISPAGVIKPEPPIAGNWVSLTNPAIISAGGLRVFFGGIHSTDPNDSSIGLMSALAPGPGGPWTPETLALDVGDPSHLYSYAGNQSAVALGDGTPLEAWAGGSLGVFINSGTALSDDPPDDMDASTTEPGDDNRVLIRNFQPDCCGYDPQLAIEGSTGQPAIAWYSNSPGASGLHVQFADSLGTPLDHALVLPGSERDQAPRARTAMTGRTGQAGLFVALADGYPIANRVVVWRVGAPATSAVSSGTGEVRNVNIAADSLGRLWVVWTRQVKGALKLFAARSDDHGATFGTPVMVDPPSGASDSFALDASAQAAALDVVGTFANGKGRAEIWYTRLEPGLTVTARPVTVSRGSKAVATVRVSDAGKPIVGATVIAIRSGRRARTGRTRRARTGRTGIARLKLGAFSRTTKLHLRVTKAGYTTAVVGERIKVRRRKR